MANTLTTIFTSTPSSLAVEAQHPTSLAWIPGTQLANGTWQVIHTGVTKTVTGAANPTVTGRLVSSITTTASVLANGPVLNNVLTTPIVGVGNATGTNNTTINVTVSSIANSGGYRLFASDSSTGTYAQIYQGTTASFSHSGLTAGQVKYYKWQYVGNGVFYDDSLVSGFFSGTSMANIGGVAANDAVIIFINGQSNAQGNAEATEALFAPMDTFSPSITQSFAMTKIWNVATSVFENMVVGTNTRSDATNTYPQGYTYAAKSDGTWDVTNPAARYNITGVGPEYGIADAWKTLGSTVPIYIIKFCEGGTSINRWLKSANDLYPKLLLHKQNAFANLTAASKNIRVLGFFRNQGEADAAMTMATYQAALTQLYTDLASDGFITSETKVVEVATPTTNDTGTPVTYAAELTAKQNFAAAGTNRYVLDAAAVALEHDEIHWNLATQYNYGYVRLSNLFFSSGLALPASIQPPAPTISFNSSTSLVTVIPPTTAWPQKEFYYTINGSAPKRLTTSFTFPIPAGVTANSGQVQVYSRAVPGRGQSGAAINTVVWVGVATTNVINWLTASGRYTTQDGSGSTTRLYRTGGANAWDAYAPASQKILAPPAGTTNAAPVASISIPNQLAVQAAIICGVSLTPTIATKDNMFAGIYVDNGNYNLSAPISGNAANYVATTTNSSVPQTGVLTLNIYTDRITMTNSANQVATYACIPFAGGQTLYVQGITYGFAGWSANQQVSQIIGATLTGGTLTAF